MSFKLKFQWKALSGANHLRSTSISTGGLRRCSTRLGGGDYVEATRQDFDEMEPEAQAILADKNRRH